MIIAIVSFHFWSQTWYPDSGDLSAAITDVVPEDWVLVETARHDGDVFRVCIDDDCPNASHQYLAAIEPGSFTEELTFRLVSVGYAVDVDDDPGGCRLPATVAPGSSFPLCNVTGADGEITLKFTAFSPAVADGPFPTAGTDMRHLIAVAATPN